LVLSSASFAAPSPAKSTDEAGRLLRSVAADARQIHSHAVAFDKLTQESGATWKEYDREWNETQPVVEMMQMKIARLEAIESSLSPSEKQALEQAKADFQKISWRTRELGNLVDMVPPDLSSPQFKTASRNLVKEASDAARVAKNGA
jgi:hypothetical protein